MLKAEIRFLRSPAETSRKDFYCLAQHFLAAKVSK